MIIGFFLSGYNMRPPAPVTLRRAQPVLIAYDPRNTLAFLVHENGDTDPDYILAAFDPTRPELNRGVSISAWVPDAPGGGGSSSSADLAVPPLRMRQRDDGLGPYDGHARILSAAQSASSGQLGLRAGTANVYDPGRLPQPGPVDPPTEL